MPGDSCAPKSEIAELEPQGGAGQLEPGAEPADALRFDGNVRQLHGDGARCAYAGTRRLGLGHRAPGNRSLVHVWEMLD